MTKPLTSTAIMMLYEEGKFQLDDPISKFIPAFANQRVFMGGSRGKMDLVPAERDITFRDLLSHTSGLTYGMMETNAVDALYRAKEGGVDFQTSTATLKEVVENAARLPLIAQPGKAWNYSISTDVLGYLVEVISGQPFEKFLVEKVIKPLGMVDTDFHVPTEKHERFAANYGAGAAGKLSLIDDPGKSRYLAPRTVNSGGGGLVSTASDYLRFCKFMLNKGELDGVKPILSPEVHANFAQAVKARDEASEKLENTLVGIRAAEIAEAYMDGRNAVVAVRFTSDQINVTRDRDGQSLGGSSTAVEELIDVWTFARDTRTDDPNWRITATRTP